MSSTKGNGTGKELKEWSREFEKKVNKRYGNESELDKAVQGFKDRVTKNLLGNGRGLNDFEVYYKTDRTIGIRQKR